MKMIGMKRPALSLGVALLAVLVSAAGAQKRFSISMPGGPTLSFGGLRLENSRVRPVERTVPVERFQDFADQSSSPPPPPANQPSPEVLQGRALAEQGMKAFYDARWADAIGLLKQAQSVLPPGDASVSLTLASAQIGLNMEALAQKGERDAAQRTAEDNVQLAKELDRLTQTLDTLRQRACQSLIDQGQFEAAVSLPTRTDFVIDSSVVDLRQARSGVVNFDVLKPPVSRSGDVGFSPPAARAEAPGIHKARLFLDSPAVEAVMFDAQISEVLGYQRSAEEGQDRFGGPVMRAVADRLNIDLDRATRQERTLVRLKAEEIWGAYDAHNRERSEETAGVAQRSVQAFQDMIERLKSQGVIRPGEDYIAKEKNDPAFRARLKAEAKAIVLEEESARRQANREAFHKMLGDVAAIFEKRGN